MLVKDFLRLYRDDAFVKVIESQIADTQQQNAHIKGLVGSLDSVLVSSLFLNKPQTCLLVLSDKEEAAYFLNDLQNLLGDESVVFFPMSYKKLYQYQDIDNANVLQRAEVLSRLNGSSEKIIVVT
jgi:transcription-repair coupling factor (superfamily II helicase)